MVYSVQSPLAHHLTVRTAPGNRPFVTPDACKILWDKMKQTFPVCYGGVIMPNHFHLVVPGSARDCRWSLGILLRSVSRSLGVSQVRWSPSPGPEALVDRTKTATVIRYVHLNPVRGHLIGDPLRWKWSTLRECLGLSLGPSWVDRDAVAGIYQVPAAQLPDTMFRFTANDGYCGLDARVPPRRWSPEMRPLASQIIAGILASHAIGRLDKMTAPLALEACMRLGGLGLVEAARAVGFSRQGAKKALDRSGDLACKVEKLKKTLADPRLYADSEAKGFQKGRQWESQQALSGG